MRAFAIAVFAAFALAACNQPAAPDIAEPSAAPTVESAPPALAPAAGAASEPPFIGAWATDAASCELDQSDPDSPMLITAKGYDQHEAHCDFNAVTPTGANAWSVAAACVTAMRSDVVFALKLDGDRLTMSSEYGGADYVRCPE